MNSWRYRTVLALILVFFGWRSTRLGLGITPGSAEYHFRRWQEQPELRRELDLALDLNPRYTAAWIAQGLESETAGDRRRAEASLLRAAETDATYLPRWTLANFYVRAGDSEKFWIWARRASVMAPDPAALFQLCWRVSGDGREISEKAIPPERAVRRAFRAHAANGAAVFENETS